jgi:hypothetical protein
MALMKAQAWSVPVRMRSASRWPFEMGFALEGGEPNLTIGRYGSTSGKEAAGAVMIFFKWTTFDHWIV